MQWQKHIAPSPRLGHRTSYRGVITATDWVQIEEELVDFWRQLATALREEYDAAHPPDWDAIFCEVWTDDGRVIAYPGLITRRERIDRVLVQVPIRQVEWEHSSFSDLIDTNANEFDRQETSLFEKMVTHLSQALVKTPDVIRQWSELKAWHPFGLFAVHFDDAETMVSLESKITRA